MAEVFISYARANEAVAKRVANGLKASGFDVWFDEQLPAHRAYSEIIEQKLRSANAVVVLWSKEAARSQWVRAEADVARANGKLVQAQLDDTLPPLPFNQIQCADLRGWRGHRKHKGWAKLAQSVASVVAGEAPPAAEPSSAPARGRFDRRHAMAALAALLVLVAAAVFLLSRLVGASDDTPKVAVLPFESVGGSDEGLVAGIWEDTRQALSRNPQLLVLGPNTSEELAKKGSGATRRAADYLVEASVRTAADRVRVSTNLVRSKDGAQIWSQTFDRKLDDVFALQSQIAQEIEGRIRGRLASGGGKQPENIATSGEVYALYSDARSKIRKRQPQFYEQAHEQLQQVVRMDPNFAPGWATLAVIKHFGMANPDDQSAEADARRAIELAPNLAAGHAALGFVLGQGPAAQSSLRRALELDSGDFEAMNWLANTLDPAKDADEKLRLYSRIVEIEPLWWPAILNKLSLLAESGNLAAVEQEFARLERLGEKHLATTTRIYLLSKSGDLSEAIRIGLAHYEDAAPEPSDPMVQLLWDPLLQLGFYELADKISPPPPSSPYIPYLRKNDPRALDIIEERMSPNGFWKFGPLPIIAGRVALLNGQGPRVAQLYRQIASTPEQFEAVVGRDRLPDLAPIAALALRSVGDEEQARKLLARALELTDHAPVWSNTQVQRARILAALGRKEEAIRLLDSAVGSRWLPAFPYWGDLALDPALAELRPDPRFEQSRTRILKHLAKERAELGPVRLSREDRSAASAPN